MGADRTLRVPCQGLERAGCKMAAIGHTQRWVSGQTKAAERESSIIKAQTRTRDKKQGGGKNRRGVLERTRAGWRDRIKWGWWRRGGGKKKKIQEENQKAKERLTALKITSISRKMTPFVGPVSSLLFKA